MKITAQEIARISIMAALSFIGSFIMIPLGPVPITLQTLFVLLSALLLSPKGAFFSQLIHLLLSLLIRGLPIIMSPSFGFLIAFLIVAPLISWIKLTGKLRNENFLIVIATLLIYLIGTPYMAFILNVVLENQLTLMQILLTGVLLFLPGDFLKGIMAVTIAKILASKAIKVKRST